MTEETEMGQADIGLLQICNDSFFFLYGWTFCLSIRGLNFRPLYTYQVRIINGWQFDIPDNLCLLGASCGDSAMH